MRVKSWRGNRGFWTAIAVAGLGIGLVALQADRSAAPAPVDRALVDRYCISCHNERARIAGLALDTVDLTQTAANAELLEKVVRKLRTGQMPPAGRPRPDKPTLDHFVASLEGSLDAVALAAPNPGRIAVHRLNRLEYINAVRDLLALDIDPSLVPADNLGVGFDNNADVLTVTPALLSRYMSAASKASRLAIGDPTIQAAVSEYKTDPYARQNVRMNEDLPFGSHGGIAINHVFPLDGEYLFKVRLQRDGVGFTIRGIDEELELVVSIDHQVVKRLKTGGEHKGFDAGYLTAIAEDDVENLQRHEYRLNADKELEFRLPVRAGPRLVTVAFADHTPMTPELVPMAPVSIKTRFYIDDASDAGVDTVQILGPDQPTTATDTPSRRKIFVCRPAAGQYADACARTILGALARRAYRRPVDEIDLRELMGLFKTGQQEAGFEAGIGLALEAILASPKFLFRIERETSGAAPGAVYRVNDAALASRLSFALWRSIPDEALLDVAAQNKLRDPAMRAQQVRRLLADPKAVRWVDDFMEQWLGVRSLQGHESDPAVFPAFDDGLRRAMATETELFFESQVREDHSVLELLSADYTFVNEPLARHYGIPNVYGNHFRRVAVTDPMRQGLLGHASILTATSYADRTSVVLRGKWVLDTLLGSPPPPPPPNVPALEKNKPGAPPKALRARMEQHRNNPVCANCHAPMDPLGFALENFDGIGRWRDNDGGATIDPVSMMPDGGKIDGPAGFRAYLLDRRDQFVNTLAGRLLEYFLGRRLEYYDRPAVRQIVRKAASNEYRWSALVQGVIESVPFQMRRTPSPDEARAAVPAAASR